LRPPQLSGRLNATSTIAGTKDAPDVSAEFKVDQGGFRQFRYESFGGTMKYDNAGITVDSRLQQNPNTWLLANGFLPKALFSNSGDKGARIDFHIDSSPIDLGLVQGFTTALTDVRGTVHAKVDVSGTADDPQPRGAITVQNAAFTSAPTGVTYTDLDGE